MEAAEAKVGAGDFPLILGPYVRPVTYSSTVQLPTVVSY